MRFNNRQRISSQFHTYCSLKRNEVQKLPWCKTQNLLYGKISDFITTFQLRSLSPCVTALRCDPAASWFHVNPFRASGAPHKCRVDMLFNRPDEKKNEQALLAGHKSRCERIH